MELLTFALRDFECLLHPVQFMRRSEAFRLNFSKLLAAELAVLCRDSSEYAVFKFNLIHVGSKYFSLA